ncbi:MAG: peptidylprolyl isomerase [Elusimicrobia bacterium]|nr:peptidylprolyl isomerase [Elusimicrobiota bacterium]
MVQKGSTVKINYTLTVDGQVVDSSTGREPLAYVQGSGQIIPGLEEQVQGMKTGDKKKLTVTPEKGYGPINPQAQQKIPRQKFQGQKDLKVGSVVQGEMGDRQFQAVIAGINDKEVTLDLNHPLAGKTLQFDIEVVDVQPPHS